MKGFSISCNDEMMATRTLLTISLLIYLFKGSELQSQSIPRNLIECYLDIDNNQHDSMTLPMTMDLFIEIIRKIEMSPYFSMDLGMFVNSILRRFWRDGIEVERNIISVDPGVISYKTTGSDSHKYDFDTIYIIPGTSGYIDFDFGNLTRTERCTLHRMLSRSVDIWERGNEFSVCQNYLDSKTVSFDAEGFRRSSCPIERGVVWSGSFGTISLSNILISIIAASRPMEVPLEYFLQRNDGLNKSVDNRWAALTGDLSEVLITQIPLKTDKYFFGPGGKWNDSDIPVAYYMTLTNTTLKNKLWQFTDAEILGAVDGLMMAQESANWLNNGNNLRLSQLLEAFYSKQLKENSIRTHACMRKTFFENISKNKNLLDQVGNFAEAFMAKTPNYIKNSSVIDSERQQLLDQFNDYAMNLLWKPISCPEGVHIIPKLKINLITDTTWSSYETLKFIMSFGESIDVSSYGSKQSVIKGDNGKLIAKSENSLGTIYQKWRKVITLGRPSLPKSLLTVRDLSLEQEAADEPFTHVTLVLATSTILTDKDLYESITLLKSIRKNIPDMYFIYVTSISHAPMYVRLTSIQGSKDDKLISEDENLQQRLLGDLSFVEELPRSIRPRQCSNLTGVENTVEITNYANPGGILYYRIHPCYLTHTSQLNIQMTNSDKGNILACVSREESANERDCKEASLTERISFLVSNPCPSRSAYGPAIEEWNQDCKPIYIRISAERSLSKCADPVVCRMPDDVPFSMTIRGLKCITNYPQCSRSGAISSSNFILIILLNIIIFSYSNYLRVR